ncbi:MAG: hypothetical protein LBK05_10435, partial [Treponema sp.]|nr:hypothetical protein [Treponema sp.]
IIGREITAFSALAEFAAPVLKDPRSAGIMMRAFELIKKLNWGFFAQMSPVTHKRLWKELVVPHPKFPAAGDIKRTLSISNLYVVMMDIHGYTKFCQESRKNLSMLHTLDRAINNEIREITGKCQSVSNRERGDEIVVVAASATDALTTALCIMDYFGGTNVVNDPAINTKRSGDASFLPEFKLSAGITGGNTSSPLIITEQGALAGFLLNSGARLQTRANELSSKDNRIMITKQVQMSYVKENGGAEKCVLFKNNTIYFLDTGLIEFKGVLLPSCEAVFRPEDRYKEKFSEALTTLFGTVRENNWEQKTFADLLNLLGTAALAMPPFFVEDRGPANGSGERSYEYVRAAGSSGSVIDNKVFADFCNMARKSYLMNDDYTEAIGRLHNLINIIKVVPFFDRLILDYARAVAEKYDFLLCDYQAAIEKEIDEKANAVFSGDHLRAYRAAKNAVQIFEKLKAIGRKSPALTKKKALWYNLIKANSDKLALTLYSGKK